MTFQREDILHLAKLANLPLTEEEVKKFQTELTSILEYVDQIQTIDVSDVDPTAYIQPLKDVRREDHMNPNNDRDRLLDLSPNRQGEQIKVPSILQRDT